MKRLRSQLTYANVVATLALFLVVAGGSALAASRLANNSVGAKQIKKEAITAAKIRKGAVTGSKIAAGAITGSNINLSSLGTVPSAAAATHAASADRATSADSATNATSAANANSLGGIPAGRYLTNTSTLLSGETEAGVWGTGAPTGAYNYGVIEFHPHLSHKIEASHLIYVANLGPSTHCPGSFRADPGYLCVYTSYNSSMIFDSFLSGTSGGGSVPADPQGLLFTMTSGGATGNARGNWAYTEP